MKRILFGIAGVLSAVLGFIGIVVPVLPTTPLLLLAAFCLSRSSKRLSVWLEQTRAYELYVKPFKETGGIPLKKKRHILALSFTVMAISAFLVQKPVVWGILAAVAAFLVWLMLVRIPTVETSLPKNKDVADGAIGVLLINSGTPDEPEIDAIARYLDEFLMDPAIIGAPWPIRRKIVDKIIATRPAQTIEKYRAFWTEEGSPFMLTSKRQAHLLQEELGSKRGSREVHVELAMRYGNPSIEAGLRTLQAKGCTSLIVLPLYPQYVKVCAGTCFKAVQKTLAKMSWHPTLVEIRDFYRQEAYQRALAEQVRAHWNGQAGSKLVLSFHSTLLKDIQNGDPYQEQVEETAEQLALNLGIPKDDIVICYQSRFDSRKWLSPFTEKTVEELATEGTSIAFVCPGFVSDNLETFFDVEQDLRALYEKHAPASCTFTYIPCLNANAGLVKALADAVHSVL